LNSERRVPLFRAGQIPLDWTTRTGSFTTRSYATCNLNTLDVSGTKYGGPTSESLGLGEDEMAFYDALEINDSAVKVQARLIPNMERLNA